MSYDEWIAASNCIILKIQLLIVVKKNIYWYFTHHFNVMIESKEMTNPRHFNFIEMS